MATKNIDTSLWNEDWFCELGCEYQLFWHYITSQCSNAGIWKPNRFDFEIKSRAKVNIDVFIEKVNERGCKERIYITETGRWFLTGYIAFQWFAKHDHFDLTLSNPLHQHMHDLLIKDKVPIEKVRGLREVLERSKETPKYKYSSKNKELLINSIDNNNNRGLGGVWEGSKETPKTETLDYQLKYAKVTNISQLSLQACLEVYLYTDKCKPSRDLLCNNRHIRFGDQDEKVAETELTRLEGWIEAFNRTLTKRNQISRGLEDWCNHLYNWMGTQNLKEDPKTILSDIKKPNNGTINRGSNATAVLASGKDFNS